jgi:hypothetical protein
LNKSILQININIGSMASLLPLEVVVSLLLLLSCSFFGFPAKCTFSYYGLTGCGVAVAADNLGLEIPTKNSIIY